MCFISSGELATDKIFGYFSSEKLQRAFIKKKGTREQRSVYRSRG